MKTLDLKKELLSDPEIVNQMLADLKNELNSILIDENLSFLRKSIFIQGVMNYAAVICAYSSCLNNDEKLKIFEEFSELCNKWMGNDIPGEDYIN